MELLTTVEHRVKPSYHIFGHIHEGYGVTTNGTTTFINASTCDKNYNARNEPIVFDLPRRTGKRNVEEQELAEKLDAVM